MPSHILLGPRVTLKRQAEREDRLALAIVLALALLLFGCLSAAAQAKIPGVGFQTPATGTVQWVWPNGSPAGSTAFDRSAGDPFGSAGGGQLAIDVFRARYGSHTPSGRVTAPDGTIGRWATDAETILGPCSRAIEAVAATGSSEMLRGRSATHTMVPTLLELHDIGALGLCGSFMQSAGIGSGAPGGSVASVGQPRIVELTSPAPGRLKVRWQTSKGHTAFEVRAGSLLVPVPGDTMAAFVELPRGESGMIEVTVRAFKGGAAGKWSRTQTVPVNARTEEPVDPTPGPVDPGPGPVDPRPAEPGPVDRCWVLRVPAAGDPALVSIPCGGDL